MTERIERGALWSGTARSDAVRRLIRDVPDFPKPGILFKDITPLLANRAGLHIVVDALTEPFLGEGIDFVVGMESRGFIFGAPVALRLGAGFVPVRKPGKLPATVDTVAYSLEYGSAELQMHRDALHPGARVLIVDDLLATGGTAAAAARLVRMQRAQVVSFAFVVELAFLHGREKLEGIDVLSLISYGAGE